MNKENIMIPVAIIVAGALIAGGIYFGGKKTTPDNANKPVTKTEVRPIDKTDHVLGNPNAKLVLIEYSDLQCPFCQTFQVSLKKISEIYNKDQVAIVFRHFPLSQIHPYAEKAAQASECIAEIGGNEKFWSFIDYVFSDKENQAQKLANINDVAVSLGIDKTAFASCLSSGKYASKVESNMKEGLDLGVNGTPTTFILSKGKLITSPLPGAIPFEQLKIVIDTILKN